MPLQRCNIQTREMFTNVARGLTEFLNFIKLPIFFLLATTQKNSYVCYTFRFESTVFTRVAEAVNLYRPRTRLSIS
jgi:hypothetical protein